MSNQTLPLGSSAIVWLLVTVLVLAIVCTLLGKPLAGLVITTVTILVIVYLLIPPVYQTVPGQGTGKWIYDKNGSIRFDPDSLAHAEATTANMTPRGLNTAPVSTLKIETGNKQRGGNSHGDNNDKHSSTRNRKRKHMKRRFATENTNRPPLPQCHQPPPRRRDPDPQQSGAVVENALVPQPVVANVPHNAFGVVDEPLTPPTACAQAIWRAPQYPVIKPSREGTIADVVPDLPQCNQLTPKQIIRNQGLYGIKGDTRCDLYQRSTYQDTRFVEPLAARNQFLAYNAYDQLHQRDSYLIPNSVSPGILHRTPPPLPQQKYST